MSDPILSRLDEERRGLALDGQVLDARARVTRVRAEDRSYYMIAWSGLTGENADAVIEEEIAHYGELGVGFEWKLYGHDLPADLMHRLECRGFRVRPREAVLVCDLAEPPQWMWSSDHGPAIRVERVERVEQVDVYRGVEQEVFGRGSAGSAQQLRRALKTGSTQVRGYIAYSGTEPVSIGRLYTRPDSWFGGLYGGGTREAFRGRGFYRATVAARARDARAAGAKYLLVDALPTSRPILERLGFRWLTDTWPCEWNLSGEKLAPSAVPRFAMSEGQNATEMHHF